MVHLGSARRILPLAVGALAMAGCVPGILAANVGTGTGGFSGDGGPAHLAQVDTPGDAAVAGGVFYVVDGNCVVRRVDVLGRISTVAGQAGNCGSTGDGGLATDATIDPFGPARRVDGGIAVDGAGNVYVDDRGAGRIRRFTPGGTITTVLTYGVGQAWIDVDLQGRLLVNVFSTVVGNPYDGIYRLEPNGSFTLLEPNTPLLGLTVGADGAWYGTTRFTAPAGVVSSIYRWPAGGTRTLVASTVQGDPPITDLAVDTDGAIYAVAGNHILTVDGTGTIVPVAGTGAPHEGVGIRGGWAVDMPITPRAIALHSAGVALVSSGHTVYRYWFPD
jgi:hypothetical protein